jgi:hypothetical protein
MQAVKFGYAGKLLPDYPTVQQAAYAVKSDATPVGVAVTRLNPYAPPLYQVVTNAEYQQALQANRLVWTALA